MKTCNGFNSTRGEMLCKFIWSLEFAATCAHRQVCSGICSDNIRSKDMMILAWLIIISITNKM